MAKNRRDRNSWGKYMVTSAASTGTGPLLCFWRRGGPKAARRPRPGLGDSHGPAAPCPAGGTVAEWYPRNRNRAVGEGCCFAQAGASGRFPAPQTSSQHLDSTRRSPPEDSLVLLLRSIGWQEGDEVGQRAVVTQPRGTRGRGSQPPLPPELRAPGGAGGSGTMRRSTPAGWQRCRPEQTQRRGARLGVLQCCSAGFNLGIDWGIWEEGKQSCGFQPSAPPRPGTPFRPAIWVALFFDFTFWRYWAHDSAPGRGAGEGEARPSGFTPRVGGRCSRRRRRECSDAGEIAAPPALLLQTWFWTISMSRLGIYFRLGLPSSSSHSAKLTTILGTKAF